jgi:flagellar protein FlaG
MNMNINAVGQTMATEGRNVSSVRKESGSSAPQTVMVTDPGVVAAKLVKNSVELDKTIQELQKISASMDRKVQFSVNKELDRVIIKIVDPSTDKVIREIPSAEIQKLQIRIKETLGLLFDQQI